MSGPGPTARPRDCGNDSAPRSDVRRCAAPARDACGQVRAEGLERAASPAPAPRWTLRRPAAAAALAVAVTLGLVIAGGSPARVIPASVGRAQLRIAGGHGELIVDHLPPAPPDRVYELWLQRGSRTPAPSTLFAVTSRGTAVLGVPGDITGVARVLVTVEPSGGTRVPTTRAVIVARV